MIIKLLCFYFVLVYHNIECSDLLKKYNLSTRKNQGVGVIGGDKADPHAFPYLVAITVDFSEDTFFCAGTLISETTILTSAHCLTDESNNIAYAAQVHLGNDEFPSSPSSGQTIRIPSNTYFKIHEKWEYSRLLNDIALIKLPKKAEIGQNIRTIDLDFSESNHVNENAIIAGWGLTKTGSASHFLRYASLYVIDNEECKEEIKLLQNSHICTAAVNKKGRRVGSCIGDSGGPLIARSKQIGIVSFGKSGCPFESPSVYTRLSEYKEWIQEHSNAQIYYSTKLCFCVVVFTIITYFK